MNWVFQTILWQAVLTLVPCLIIVGIFKLINKKRDAQQEKEE